MYQRDCSLLSFHSEWRVTRGTFLIRMLPDRRVLRDYYWHSLRQNFKGHIRFDSLANALIIATAWDWNPEHMRRIYIFIHQHIRNNAHHFPVKVTVTYIHAHTCMRARAHTHTHIHNTSFARIKEKIGISDTFLSFNQAISHTWELQGILRKYFIQWISSNDLTTEIEFSPKFLALSTRIYSTVISYTNVYINIIFVAYHINLQWKVKGNLN